MKVVRMHYITGGVVTKNESKTIKNDFFVNWNNAEIYDK